MADQKPRRKTATEAVAETIEGLDPGVVLTNFTVVAEVIDTDGDRSVWVLRPETAKCWDTLGLLQYALASVVDEA